MKSEKERVVSKCVRYWKRTAVPRDAIREMQIELERHLEEAASEGVGSERVTGPDVVAFAESWAREFRSPRVAEAGLPRLIPAALAATASWVAFVHAGQLWHERALLFPEDILVRTIEFVPSARLWFWSLIAAGIMCAAAALLLALRYNVIPSILLLAVTPVGIVAHAGYSWAIGVLAAAALAWFHLTLRWKRPAKGKRRGMQRPTLHERASIGG